MVFFMFFSSAPSFLAAAAAGLEDRTWAGRSASTSTLSVRGQEKENLCRPKRKSKNFGKYQLSRNKVTRRHLSLSLSCWEKREEKGELLGGTLRKCDYYYYYYLYFILSALNPTTGKDLEN
jgi:hypothetical protein